MSNIKLYTQYNYIGKYISTQVDVEEKLLCICKNVLWNLEHVKSMKTRLKGRLEFVVIIRILYVLQFQYLNFNKKDIKQLSATSKDKKVTQVKHKRTQQRLKILTDTSTNMQVGSNVQHQDSKNRPGFSKTIANCIAN